jgi:hypothetical protein
VYPVTPVFLAALRSPHTAVVQVDAYLAGALIASDLPVDDKGSSEVIIDVGSQVRRTLTSPSRRRQGCGTCSCRPVPSCDPSAASATRPATSSGCRWAGSTSTSRGSATPRRAACR